MGAGRFPYEERIPHLSNFCCFFQVRDGVKVGAIAMIIYTALVLAIQIVNDRDNVANTVWSVIWLGFNFAAFFGVLAALWKDLPKLIIPAMLICVIDVLLSIISAIVNFVFLAWFSAVLTIIFAGLAAYYFVACKSVYDDMNSVSSVGDAEAGEEMKHQQKQLNPA